MLKGKIALVTGTSRGIGRQIALTFAGNGAVVYANARKEGSLDSLTEESKNMNGKVMPLYFDVTDTDALKNAFIRIKKENRKLDCLVNNAGIMQDALIGMIDKKTIHDVFETNVFAVMELTQLAARIMIKQQSGSIINLASIVGINGNKGQLVYSASKGAVIAMTKTAAKELAPQNIRVNAIAPGMIDTEMFRSIGTEKTTERLGNIGMGRLGTTENVAKTCLFLASDLSEYVTGQIVGVDGATII
ncbi:MAG: SDR family oxidoreductase [Treponema sp.]|jgi:3-oxoacyl-[acyl-carrier protein] reductase|nr:SDR family oxidoreductase [Treponema sp.]